MEGDDLPVCVSKPLQRRDVATGFRSVKERMFMVWENKGVPMSACCMRVRW